MHQTTFGKVSAFFYFLDFFVILLIFFNFYVFRFMIFLKIFFWSPNFLHQVFARLQLREFNTKIFYEIENTNTPNYKNFHYKIDLTINHSA